MKPLFSFCLVIAALFFSVTAHADSTNTLGRLFTTAFERDRIDAVRRNTGKAGKVGKAGDKAVDVQHNTVVNKVQLKGIVIRESGDNVVWVNEHSNIKSNRINESIRVYPRRIDRSRSRVAVRVSDKWLHLRPGEIWDSSSGSIKDYYLSKEARFEETGVKKQPHDADKMINEAAEESGH